MSLNLSIMLILLSVTALLSTSEANGARTFVFGIPQNVRDQASYSKIIITTVSKETLRVNVTLGGGLQYSGTVSASHSYSLSIPESLIVKNSYSQDRNKGIIVEASGEVEVTAYNRLTTSTESIGAFRVLPYSSLPELYQYRYIAVSTGSTFKFHGLILLVGCEEETIVNIKPSVTVEMPQDLQLSNSNITVVAEGQNHQVVLHKGQTLLLKVLKGNFTGTEIISNKPLTVVSGHECGRMPESEGGCDQLLAQIPPTVTWGKDFILLPLSGRISGHIYKVIASQNDTTINHNCNDTVGSPFVLSDREVMEFWSPSDRSCHVKADKPIMVAQFSLGQDTDGVGDPTLTIVPPKEQYVHEISFKSFSGDSSINDQYMNIIVPSDCFHHNLIRLDGEVIMCEWSLVYSYDSETVIGYTCKKSLEADTVHTLTHIKPGGHMALSVCGFTGRKGYAYNAGFALQPLNSIVKVLFSKSSYQVRENDEYVLVQVTRMDDVVSPAGVTVIALSGTAHSSKDYVQLKQDLIFEVGEKHKTVKVYMIDDDCVEERETFKLVIEPHNIYSPSSEATVDIIDDDSIQIGFYSPQDGGQALYEDDEKMFVVEIMNGSFPSDDETANITLSLEIVESTDTAAPPHVEMVTFSSGKNRTVILYKQRSHDNDISSLVGFLKVDKTDKVDQDQVYLKPSVNILHVHPLMSSSMVSVIATATPTGEPTAPPFIEYHTSSQSTSISTIVLIASISSFCTALVVVAFALFGCFLSYKYGQNNDFRYQYFRRKTPPRETYIVHEVVNSV
ncbi:PREDICTED: uncharacterized protein LOC100639782 [Amphimedon queenslandica]|uniref:Calx-beta domain-containing protein n=1 Tax=Amphimedon queenslandica TaxID=400682 RepID=A0A1X7UX25_AMPQE|nr:PREDICTED: uncharacterized protein LOC100639782 [Amphimedon queenslandica]|eukprot:XP_003386601.1 PREDICTED: uncharacterized protein LOC100639782 [Amphimedon queenslandica]